MEHAKKMVLIEPRLLEKWKETVQNKTLSKLDDEIGALLNQNIPDDEKAKLYSSTLNRFLKIEKPQTTAKPTLSESTETAPSTNDTATGTDPVELEDGEPQHIQTVESLTLSTIPKKFRSKAANLMSHIRNNTDIRWNAKGELIVDDTIVPKTNIVDLINDLSRARKNVSHPRGMMALTNSLKESNVPRELIGNEHLWEFMNKSSISQRPLLQRQLANTPTTAARKKFSKAKVFNWQTY